MLIHIKIADAKAQSYKKVYVCLKVAYVEDQRHAYKIKVQLELCVCVCLFEFLLISNLY